MDAKFDLRFHPQAVEEAEEARDWYEVRSPAAAQRFLRELDAGFESIRSAPHRWPSYTHGSRRYVLDRFPFSIIYRGRADVVEVVCEG